MSIIESFSPIARGVGSPEGKVAAPVGSTYTDTAATNGAIRWIKTTPSGVTGWKVEYGDTGWRSITGFTASGITVSAGYVNARRVGDEVNLVFEGIKTSRSGNVVLFNLPVGFRPGSTPVRFTTDTYWSGDTVETGRVTSSGIVEFRGLTAAHQFSFSLYYLTTNAWPATLPGTPA